MAGCSYDVHLQEIMGGLTTGATLIMLHPQGNMDSGYVLKLIEKKEISYMQIVPSYLSMMFDTIKLSSKVNLSPLRTIDIGGK